MSGSSANKSLSPQDSSSSTETQGQAPRTPSSLNRQDYFGSSFSASGSRNESAGGTSKKTWFGSATRDGIASQSDARSDRTDHPDDSPSTLPGSTCQKDFTQGSASCKNSLDSSASQHWAASMEECFDHVSGDSVDLPAATAAMKVSEDARSLSRVDSAPDRSTAKTSCENTRKSVSMTPPVSSILNFGGSSSQSPHTRLTPTSQEKGLISIIQLSSSGTPTFVGAGLEGGAIGTPTAVGAVSGGVGQGKGAGGLDLPVLMTVSERGIVNEEHETQVDFLCACA